MKSSSRGAFTLVELLVVIAMIGVLISLLLPGVQAARESARRASCANNLVQLIIGVHNYESAFRLYPAGTIEPMGPIQNVNLGYHHGWITQLLPYIEQRVAYQHLDRSVGVYDPRNVPVRDLNIRTLTCPSSDFDSPACSNYAGAHHDIESPIDANNNGVFFLNSKVRYLDVSDGASQTLFLGEKLVPPGDLGWISGTRATLRNTGTPINAVLAVKSTLRGRAGPPSVNGTGFLYDPDAEDYPGMGAIGLDPGAMGDQPLATDETSATASPEDKPDTDKPDAETSTEPPAVPPIADGIPTTPTAVGGFESEHTGGANFALGDGSVRLIAQTIDLKVYQQLGHRADGQLLNQDF